jgi:hypothetical protein
MSQFESLCE